MESKIYINRTKPNAEYRKALRCSRFYDLKQRKFLFSAGCVLLVSVIFALLFRRALAVGTCFFGVLLLWLRPLCGLFSKNDISEESCVTFSDTQILQTIGSKENIYYYGLLERTTVRGRWIFLEFSKETLLLDGAGFAEGELQEFIDFLKLRRPDAPLRKKENSLLLQLLPLIAATAISINAINLCLSAGSALRNTDTKTQLPVQEEVQTQPDTTELTEISFKALTTMDGGTIFIDLPGDFISFDEPKGYYSEKHGIQLIIRSYAKVWKDAETLEDFAAYLAESYRESDALQSVEFSGEKSLSGNLFIISTDETRSGYQIFAENEYFYFSLTFSCKKEIFHSYLPYFYQWESTICFHENPLEVLLAHEKNWAVKDVVLTLPTSMEEGRSDSWKLALKNPAGFDVFANYEEKNGYDLHSYAKERFEISTEDMEMTEEGYCICRMPEEEGSENASFLVFVETEEHMVVIMFRCEGKDLDLFEPMFLDWIAKIKVKSSD